MLFAASAGSRLQIYDLSPLLEGRGKEPGTAPAPVRTLDTAHGFGNSNGSGIHSFSVSNDGKRGYFALLTRGFGVVDFTDFTDNDPATNTYRTITPTANRPTWPGPGAHSAVKLWNQDWVYVSDEVYGIDHRQRPRLPMGLDAHGRHRRRDAAGRAQRVPAGGEPAALLHELQPAAGVLLRPQPDADAEHRVQHLALGRLPGDGHDQPDQRLRSWRSSSRRRSTMVGTEDPRLSGEVVDPGERVDQKVVMWSYPVIQDGLIYTVDLRNGLYILKYNGPYSHEVDSVGFLEGNSNQGDALCFEPVPGADACRTARPRSRRRAARAARCRPRCR